VDGQAVRWAFGVDDHGVLHQKFLAQTCDSAAKVDKLVVTAADVSAELGAAELVAFDRVIECPMRQLRHIKKMKA
jgi:hypothetical protein